MLKQKKKNPKIQKSNLAHFKPKSSKPASVKCPEPRHSVDNVYYSDPPQFTYKNDGSKNLNLLERLVLANCNATRFAHHLSF